MVGSLHAWQDTSRRPRRDSRQGGRTGEDGPISFAEFVVGGQVFMGYNGGSYFTFSEGFSLYVDCEDQAEVDEYWDKRIKAGAMPTACGWIKDPFGLSWQIVPRRFMELIRDENPKTLKAVMDAMMTMVKLDVAAFERAYDEAQQCAGPRLQLVAITARQLHAAHDAARQRRCRTSVDRRTRRSGDEEPRLTKAHYRKDSAAVYSSLRNPWCEAATEVDARAEKGGHP